MGYGVIGVIVNLRVIVNISLKDIKIIFFDICIKIDYYCLYFHTKYNLYIYI